MDRTLGIPSRLLPPSATIVPWSLVALAAIWLAGRIPEFAGPIGVAAGFLVLAVARPPEWPTGDHRTDRLFVLLGLPLVVLTVPAQFSGSAVLHVVATLASVVFALAWLVRTRRGGRSSPSLTRAST